MGFFSDMAGAAAKGAGISVRKAKIKKEVETQRAQAADELEKHDMAFKKFIELEHKKYLSAREHYIVSYMFAQVMLGENMSQRDFSFFDQMPGEYRNGSEFKKNLAKVEEKYYSFLANAFKDCEITVPSIISCLKDLLYFDELRDDIESMIAAEPYLKSEVAASASVFSESSDISAMMQRVRDYNIMDTMRTMGEFVDGITVSESSDFKGALRHWLLGSYSKEELDDIKIAVLHLAQEEDQNEAIVEIYDCYKKLCKRTFGLSTVKKVDGKEEVVIYPPVDMVIAEVLRHICSGTADQYNADLKEWIETCGERIGGEQLNVLQNVFFHLNAFEQEEIVLEHMVRHNIARSAEQEQRLKFLKGNHTTGSMGQTTFQAINVQAGENDLLYDHRFVNWKVNEIQQYFSNLTLTRTSQIHKMVIDEWQKDVSIPGILWNNEEVLKLVSAEMEKNFGRVYEVSIVDAGAAVDDWVDVLPSIYIRAMDAGVRNSELSFLVVGEQVTNSTVHLTIMVLLAPIVQASEATENDVLCKKMIAVKEKHNPRVDTFISTVKNILIGQLETWINQFNNKQEIY